MSVLIGLLGAYEQWGVVKGNGVSQTFPLAFATRCFAVAVTANIGSSRAVASSAWDVNKTSAIFYADITNAPSAGWYYAIGVQQWGYVSHNNVRSDTPKVAVFPISFTKTIYTISTQLHMTNVRSDLGTGPYIVSYSNNQMSILFNIESSGVIMDGAWWLVIGR